MLSNDIICCINATRFMHFYYNITILKNSNKNFNKLDLKKFHKKNTSKKHTFLKLSDIYKDLK